jgi:hypothetical protein
MDIHLLRQHSRNCFLPALNFEHQPSPKELHQHEDVDGEADAMMRVRQRSFRPNSKEAQNKHNRRQQYCQDLQINMQLKTEPRIPLSKLRYQDSSRQDAEECDGRDDTVASYERVVLR